MLLHALLSNGIKPLRPAANVLRYHRALQGLKEESKLLAANPMSLSGQYDQRRGIVTDLLHLLVTSEDPSYYIKSFEHLAAWVDNSLDQYKVLTMALCVGLLIEHSSLSPLCAASRPCGVLRRHRCCPCPCKGNMRSLGQCCIP